MDIGEPACRVCRETKMSGSRCWACGHDDQNYKPFDPEYEVVFQIFRILDLFLNDKVHDYLREKGANKKALEYFESLNGFFLESYMDVFHGELCGPIWENKAAKEKIKNILREKIVNRLKNE